MTLQGQSCGCLVCCSSAISANGFRCALNGGAALDARFKFCMASCNLNQVRQHHCQSDWHLGNRLYKSSLKDGAMLHGLRHSVSCVWLSGLSRIDALPCILMMSWPTKGATGVARTTNLQSTLWRRFCGKASAGFQSQSGAGH